MTASRTNIAGSPVAIEDIADHGGSLGRADTLYPGAPKPWLDLSTGINAVPYPLPEMATSTVQRLPEAADLAALQIAAAHAYSVASSDQVVCAPGTQILLPMIMSLVAPGRAAVLSPTYAEHARAARLCGHEVFETGDFEALGSADLAVVVNPNNPDGRLHTPAALLEIAERLDQRGGLLVVDEAFMDVCADDHRLDGMLVGRNIVVLRSFGKFFGLAGLRLGFALCDAPLANRLRGGLGPWAVSGPALAAGLAALPDQAWQEEARKKLAICAKRLDALLRSAGLQVVGGTTLYRYVRHPQVASLVQTLGAAGILVRTFSFDETALRFGIPRRDEDFSRLSEALECWSSR